MPRKTALLLDTHVWVWLNNRSPELNSKTVNLIEESASHGSLYISAISVWELATLAAKRKITLLHPIADWISEALSQPGVSLLPLSPEISIESTALPGQLHGDPADRIIIASARVKRLSLLTRDSKILQYAQQGYVNSIKA